MFSLTLHAAHGVCRGGGHEGRRDAERGGLADVGDLVGVLGVDEQAVRLLQRVAQLALEPVPGLKPERYRSGNPADSADNATRFLFKFSTPFVLHTCKSLASEGSTGFRHWIILLILFGEDGRGCEVAGGNGTTGVRVVYEKPDEEEEEDLASAQLLFSGLSFLLRFENHDCIPSECGVAPSSNELGFTELNHFLNEEGESLFSVRPSVLRGGRRESGRRVN